MTAETLVLLRTMMLEVTSVVVPLQEELVVTLHVASEHLPTFSTTFTFR
jgi:hypothetical protein